jgi:hypothetical protein
MDSHVREAAIDTITRYAQTGDDPHLLELIGFTCARNDVSDEMEAAAIVAVLPLLSDERLNVLMRHIAEVLVDAQQETQVAA